MADVPRGEEDYDIGEEKAAVVPLQFEGFQLLSRACLGKTTSSHVAKTGLGRIQRENV